MNYLVSPLAVAIVRASQVSDPDLIRRLRTLVDRIEEGGRQPRTLDLLFGEHEASLLFAPGSGDHDVTVNAQIEGDSFALNEDILILNRVPEAIRSQHVALLESGSLSLHDLIESQGLPDLPVTAIRSEMSMTYSLQSPVYYATHSPEAFLAAFG